MIAIGAERYLYDRVSRLVSGSVLGNTKTQSYDYDPFGNILRVTVNGTWVRELAPDPATNRLTSLGWAAVTYDAAGSLTSRGDLSFTWDPFAMLQRIQGPGLDRTYLYTAADERLAVIDQQLGGVETWRVRDLENRILREWQVDVAGTWTWREDWIHRPGQVVAKQETGQAIRHYHPDHLGSTRLITRPDGSVASRHTYFPFGEEATDPAQTAQPLRFTGHERDLNAGGKPDDLDYMHARYYASFLGRFATTDPKTIGQPVPRPQRLNRYTYTAGNPLKFNDPDGRDLTLLYDFTGSGLDVNDQLRIAYAVRQRFVNAGVQNVRSAFSTDEVPARVVGKHKTAKIFFRPVVRHKGRKVMGRTTSSSTRSYISTSKIPSGRAEAITHLTNAISHEVGHQTFATLDITHSQTEAGSLMAMPSSEALWSEQVLEFSLGQSFNLMKHLNEPEENEESGRFSYYFQYVEGASE